MKTTDLAIYTTIILLILFAFNTGMVYSEKETKEIKEAQTELIETQNEYIDILENRLQTSNEKRGRLFLALLYTDIPGREKELDSLLIEIGKDN